MVRRVLRIQPGNGGRRGDEPIQRMDVMAVLQCQLTDMRESIGGAAPALLRFTISSPYQGAADG